MKRIRVNLREHKEIMIDPSPFRVSGKLPALRTKAKHQWRAGLLTFVSTTRLEYMPLEQIHILFEMLRCSRVFVTSYGILVGVISRDVLIESLSEKIAVIREYNLQHVASTFVRSRLGLRSKSHREQLD
eukprot:scaffold442_cov268-Pinguiococcus_pyrenoidosus.AAC.93